MKLPSGNAFNIGRRLKVLLALLIALILGGNGLVIFQFERARAQTDRLTGVSQQLIAVLRLQDGLLSFHQRLNELAQSKDANGLWRAAEPMRTALLQQSRETKTALAYLPPGFRVDPAFLTALDTMEITLPSQLQDITALANVGDWEAVQLRVDNELKRIEDTTSAHVKSIDRELDEELPRVVANMRDVQGRVLLVVPITAISTVFIAAFFGGAIARRLLELRLEERVNERTRIARELHDTLLQSFQAVLLKFHAVTYMLADRPDAEKALEGVIDQARRAVIEGRDAVHGLRSSKISACDLADAIGALGEELADERANDPEGRSRPEFSVRPEGAARDLAPLVIDEVHQIACELVRNAFRHAEAKAIAVEIRFGERQFRLLIRDNGKGIDPEILAVGGRAGHYGLLGMRERAKLLGGRVAITSQPGSGTEAELSIPASFAYLKPTAARSQAASGQEG